MITAAVLGFPVALVFGWLFDITAHGIVRTKSAGVRENAEFNLKRADYLILVALAAVAVAVLYTSVDNVRQSTSEQSLGIEKTPNSIAVMPFENFDGDQDTEYFSDGITEEILHHLSSFKALHVLGRSSSFAFRASDLAVPRISEILRVSYILRGSVRREANNVRIVAELVDDTGFQVWSETFDRKLEGVFSIQSDIANTVARQLVKEIAPHNINPASSTTNIDAYQEYLIGRDFLNRRSPGWQGHAAEAFLRSTKLDPGFAPPYAGLAVARAIGARADMEMYQEHVAEAQSYVDRALSLNPELAEAHAAQGLILIMGQGADFVAAESALRRAIDLDPTLVIAYNWLSIAVGSQGKFAEGRKVRESALLIDPLNPVMVENEAARHSNQGDFRRAEKLLLRLMELPEPSGSAQRGLYNLYTSYGRMVDANMWAKRLVLANADRPSIWNYALIGHHYRSLGMNNDADYWYEKAVAVATDGMRVFFVRSYSHKLQGKYADLKVLTEEFLKNSQVDESKLPVFAAEILGAIKISIGDYADGIALIETILDPDKPISTTSGGGYDALDFMHMVAYGYRQNGQPEKADVLLEKLSSRVNNISDNYQSEQPKFLELRALNSGMRGDMDRAARHFESAVNIGWRNYLFVVNDPRWQEILENPEFKSQMAFVKSDLDRQSERIRAIDVKENFRAIVEQLETDNDRIGSKLTR